MPWKIPHVLIPTLRRPRLVLAIVLPLALGIGPAITMMALIGDLVAGSPGVPESDRLLVVTQRLPELGDQPLPMSAAPYLALAEQAAVDSRWHFGDLAAMQVAQRTMTGVGDPRHLSVAAVTPSFFSLVGAVPEVGRPLVAADGEGAGLASSVYGEGAVAVLSHTLWTSAFGADPDIVGRSLTLDGRDFEIVGVAPATLRYPSQVEVWLPLRFGGLASQDYGGFYFQVLLRPDPALSPIHLEERLQRVAVSLRPAVPSLTRDLDFVTQTVRDQVFGDLKPPSLLLLGLTLVVIVGVTFNGTQVMTARAIERRRDLALHAALGATRGRLTAYLVVEGIALALAGWVLGLGLALLLLRTLGASIPIHHLALGSLQLASPVTLVSGILAAGVGLVLGWVPAILWRRSVPTDGLDGNSGRHTETRREGALLGTLLAAQLAFALILVSGGVAFVSSFQELSAVDLGFDPDGVFTLDLELADAGDGGLPLNRRIDLIVEHLKTLPAVETAGGGLRLPVLDSGGGIWYTVPGAVGEARSTPVPATLNSVTTDFLAVLEVDPVAGRGFAPSDREGAEPVVIVDETLAHQHFGSASPVGQFLVLTPWPEVQRRIVGVVPALRYGGLRAAPSSAVYVPSDQVPLARVRVVVAGHPGSALALDDLQQQVWMVAPEVALDSVGTFRDRLWQQNSSERWVLRLTLLLAGLGLVLCLTSVYGVTVRLVNEKRRDLGIRSALGCPPKRLLSTLFARQTPFIVLGVCTGLLIVGLGGRYVQSLVHYVNPGNLAVLAVATLVLLATVVCAGLIPARRAARIDPGEVLKEFGEAS